MHVCQSFCNREIFYFTGMTYFVENETALLHYVMSSVKHNQVDLRKGGKLLKFSRNLTHLTESKPGLSAEQTSWNPILFRELLSSITTGGSAKSSRFSFSKFIIILISQESQQLEWDFTPVSIQRLPNPHSSPRTVFRINLFNCASLLPLLMGSRFYDWLNLMNIAAIFASLSFLRCAFPKSWLDEKLSRSSMWRLGGPNFTRLVNGRLFFVAGTFFLLSWMIPRRKTRKKIWGSRYRQWRR